MASLPEESSPAGTSRVRQNHRTVDRITRILEEVVYRPGMTFGELARAVDAPKSSVHGFITGLLAAGWVYQQDRRFYLGPAVHALTLAGGSIQTGLVTHADLYGLQEKTGLAVFVGVLAGEHLMYVAELGSDPVAGFEARSNIRRRPLATAGGKALLAACSDAEREAYLRRRDSQEAELVADFLEELAAIRGTHIATNTRYGGRRFAIATAIRNPSGVAVASVTLVGASNDLHPRQEELSALLLQHVASWRQRPVTVPEAI